MIRLAEEFFSIQGEGSLAGVPTYFARFAGCSVSQCPLHPHQGGPCDTDWQYRYSKTPAEIVEEARKHRAHWLCITGGEPTDQAGGMYALIEAAHRAGMRVTLQTSGAKEVNVEVVDWLVVSPKLPVTQIKQTRGHELKVVNTPPLVHDFGSLRGWDLLTAFIHLWLQPLWKKDGTSNAEQTAWLVLRACEIGAGPWKLSIQQHKYWGGR